jgi:octaprenyl-diphosphate synthase
MSDSPQSSNSGNVAADFSIIRQHAEAYLDAINVFIEDQVKDFEPEIQDLIQYCLVKGGKRIRPVLVFFSGYQDAETPNADLVKLGAVIELVHMATLVHDDILDQAAIRHGRPSVVEKYGSAVAVLLGDALFSHALRLAAEFPTVEVCREVATSTRTVCAGEIHQTFQRGDVKTSLSDYYRSIEMKTAELFRVACYLGAKIGGYDLEFAEACAVYGNALGTAYQIFDDYADIFSTEDRMGKTLNTDILKGKYTLPLILLFEAMEEKDVKNLVKELNNSEDVPVNRLETLMETYQIKGKVMQHFNEQIEVGETALAAFKNRPATKRLDELLRFVSAQIGVLT